MLGSLLHHGAPVTEQSFSLGRVLGLVMKGVKGSHRDVEAFLGIKIHQLIPNVPLVVKTLRHATRNQRLVRFLQPIAHLRPTRVEDQSKLNMVLRYTCCCRCCGRFPIQQTIYKRIRLKACHFSFLLLLYRTSSTMFCIEYEFCFLYRRYMEPTSVALSLDTDSTCVRRRVSTNESCSLPNTNVIGEISKLQVLSLSPLVAQPLIPQFSPSNKRRRRRKKSEK